MITRETAIALARDYFKQQVSTRPHMANVDVHEKQIVEASFAWILPWNDRRFVENPQSPHQILGNKPLVVLKSDGAIMELPSLTKDEYVRWNSRGFHGAIEHRIANLAQKLGYG